MNREKLAYWAELILIGFVTAVLLYAPIATGAVRNIDFVYLMSLAGAALLVWTFRIWLGGIRWHPVNWVFLVFIGYAAWRYFEADVEYVARLELLRILVYFAFWLMISTVITASRATPVWLTVWSVLAALLSGYAIYQFFTSSPAVLHFVKPLGYARRGSGTFINPNHLAAYLAMLLPFFLAFTLSGKFGVAVRICLGYVAALSIMGIFVTFSRAGWAAAALGVICFLLFLAWSRSIWKKTALLGVGILLLAAVISHYTPQYRKRFETPIATSTTGDIRMLVWADAKRMWQDHFWFGTGPGHFDIRYGGYRSPHWMVQRRPAYVHNDYLNLLTDWGLVGASLTLLAILVFFIDAIRKWTKGMSRKASRSAVPIIAGGLFGAFALFLHSVFEFNLHIPALVLTLVALAALVGAAASDPVEVEPPQKYFVLPLLTLLGLGLAGVLLFYCVKLQTESKLLEKAAGAGSDIPQKLQLLEAASQAEPNNPETPYQIAEIHRNRAWAGLTGYEEHARAALPWYKKSIALNPHDPMPPLGYAMCLTWIKKFDEAETYYKQALSVDPNNYYASALYGWHLFEQAKLKEAEHWLFRSLTLYNNHNNRNSIAATYYNMVQRRLKDAGTAQ